MVHCAVTKCGFIVEVFLRSANLAIILVATKIIGSLTLYFGVMCKSKRAVGPIIFVVQRIKYV
jgi:hypothetical protein